MNEDLKYAFSNVNDWLKFAEAKNAGLLALNAGAIIGLLQAADKFFSALPWSRGILIIAFCASSAVCLYSILPQVNIWFKSYKKLEDAEFARQKSKLNFLFFGHLSQLSKEQLLELYKEGNPNAQITSADSDLAFQIVNNAEIASQKFAVFKVSCWITFMAAVAGVMFVIIGAF